jgi:hypothetical protein
MTDTVADYKAGSKLAKLLKDAAQADRLLRVEADGDTYELRVHREGTPLRRVEDYDPERARKALMNSFGVLSDLDADAFIAEMKANRE